MGWVIINYLGEVWAETFTNGKRPFFRCPWVTAFSQRVEFIL